MEKLSVEFQIRHSKALFLIGIFYVLIPAAIALRFIPFELRFILLMAVTPVLFFLRPSKKTRNVDLGIELKNAIKSIIDLVPITFALAILTVAIAALNEPRYDNSELTIFFYLFYALISCPFQEFVYRGYLFHVLDVLQIGKWARIIVGAILYSFVHIIYADPYILLSTFIVGVLWNIHYDKLRNLAGVTVSHAVLGVLTIVLGLI
ncbi:MAG: CPBP family intramembrane glutamic endopeptidase [Cyanobacteria bacterium P01_C01_bin.120]